MVNSAIRLHLNGAINHVALWHRVMEFTKQGAEEISDTHTHPTLAP